MTDELSPEFLRFSEMLDDEDALDEVAVGRLGEDGQLLLDLRQALRQDRLDVPALPGDFAKSTAAAVDLRFQALPALTRALVRIDPVFHGPLFTRLTLPWLALLGGSSLICGCVSWKILGFYGAALLAGSLLLSLGCKFALPNPLSLGAEPVRVAPHFRDSGIVGSELIFYALPVSATILTALLCGRFWSSLGIFSLSFQENAGSLAWAALAFGVVVLGFLCYALVPTWKAFRQLSGRHRAWSLLFQAFHGLWFSGALVALLTLEDAIVAKEQNGASLLNAQAWASPGTLRNVWLAVLVIGFLATFLSRSSGQSKPTREILLPALGKTFSSFFFGGLPILAVTVGFYQLSLTRQLHDVASYEMVVEQTERWMAEQRAIPPAQNGWMDLREIFLRQDVPTKDIVAIQERLKDGGQLYDYWLKDTRIEPQLSDQAATERTRVARGNFLLELPRIQAALAKPQFSYAATQDLSLQALTPNFILCRAVSQGLAGLSAEALYNDKAEESLRYTEMGLAWSGKFRQGGLLNLMITIAQLKITTETLERLVLEGQLTVPQLKRLQRSLDAAELARDDYRNAMVREISMVDRAFREVLLRERADPSVFSSMSTSGMATGLAEVMPLSYWESERKAYLNFQLAQLGDWRDLAKPSHVKVEEVLPFSLAMRDIVPYTARAQAQFTSALSRVSALRLVTALEIYRQEKRRYPDRLEQLVGIGGIASLPVDAMSANLWDKKPTFSYSKTPAGYELVSESSVYQEIGMKMRQVYGHDGRYQADL